MNLDCVHCYLGGNQLTSETLDQATLLCARYTWLCFLNQHQTKFWRIITFKVWFPSEKPKTLLLSSCSIAATIPEFCFSSSKENNPGRTEFGSVSYMWKTQIFVESKFESLVFPLCWAARFYLDRELDKHITGDAWITICLLATGIRLKSMDKEYHYC